MSTAHATTTANTDRIRLHITPFNPGLVDRLVPPSARHLATNTSYHTVQTYPERGFGYVELPAMEAEKLKKKLNGSTLKGTKVRIEEARPEKKRKVEREDTEDGRELRKKAKKDKRGREDGVLPGYELEEGRHVKRGWSDGDAKKKSSKASRIKQGPRGAPESLERKELRFKTSLPPNAVSLDEKTKSKSKSKDKKAKLDRDGKKKVVIQEFVNRSKSSARASTESDAAGQTTRYEDGIGWVDEVGNVVEAERPSRKVKRVIDIMGAIPSDQAMENESSSPDETGDERINLEAYRGDQPAQAPQAMQSPSQPDTLEINGQKQNESSSSEEDTMDGAVSDAQTAGAKAVHPLEALFKRPARKSETDSTKYKPLPIDTSFSFFGAGETDEGDEEPSVTYPPQTPRTREDLEWRGLRSAAPTPDTAAIGKRFSFPFAGDDEEDESEEVGDDDERTTPRVGDKPATRQNGEAKGDSEFRKDFYNRRGDLNRAWKKRRREAKKQQRQRENRRLSRRVV